MTLDEPVDQATTPAPGTAEPTTAAHRLAVALGTAGVPGAADRASADSTAIAEAAPAGPDVP